MTLAELEEVFMTLDQLEEIYMNGFDDEQTGDVDWRYHCYRVGRYLVFTDSNGFHAVEPYPTDEDATVAFNAVDAEYSEWEVTE